MIALTTRLNERDEAILQMQEELDAYDKIHKETETVKRGMRRRIKGLEEYITQDGSPLPEFDDDQEDEEEDKEKVKVGDFETFNITYNNLLSPDEKIKELTQIADNRKNQIDELKHQIKSLEADNSQQDYSQKNKGDSMSHSSKALFTKTIHRRRTQKTFPTSPTPSMT
jgi:chromosome segregation ATPase